MSTVVKSAILSLSLLTGAALNAYAQSESIAALPPGEIAAPPTAPAPVGPAAVFLGPDPGKLWSTSEKNTGPAQPSPKYVGPDPGKLWSAAEKNSGPAQPSPQYVGPAPSSENGSDAE